MNLRDAVRRGVPLRPLRGRHQTVRGEELRALLISCGTETAITPAGVKIDGGSSRLITITADKGGIIDLGDLKPHDGKALPSLTITNCVIDGDLRIANSHFTALRIADSEVNTIDARLCRISCDLSLDGLVTEGITLRDAKIAGALELIGVELGCPFGPNRSARSPADMGAGDTVALDVNGVAADAVRLRRLTLACAEHSVSDEPSKTAIFDLRGVKCRIFDDDDARVWSGLGERYRWSLLLEGITFEALDHSGGVRSQLTANSDQNLGDEAALRSLRRRTMLMAFDEPASGIGTYSKLARAPRYSAQPYVVFAQAYSRAGERGIATEVATDQIRLRWAGAALVIKRRVRANPGLSACLCALLSVMLVGFYYYPEISAAIKTGDMISLRWSMLVKSWIVIAVLTTGALWVSHWIVSVFGYLFDAFFAFGLRPQRAVVSMGIYLIIGVLGVSAAAEAGALYPSTTIGGPHHASEQNQSSWTSRAIGAVHQISVEGCNQANSNGIDRAIYALDVFIPALDLRQECAFTFGPGGHEGWRLAKSLYALLGWVFVSLTLLSLSGVLRRDIEG